MNEENGDLSLSEPMQSPPPASVETPDLTNECDASKKSDKQKG